jgi:hypothetical protein
MAGTGESAQDARVRVLYCGEILWCQRAGLANWICSSPSSVNTPSIMQQWKWTGAAPVRNRDRALPAERLQLRAADDGGVGGTEQLLLALVTGHLPRTSEFALAFGRTLDARFFVFAKFTRERVKNRPAAKGIPTNELPRIRSGRFVSWPGFIRSVHSPRLTDVGRFRSVCQCPSSFGSCNGHRGRHRATALNFDISRAFERYDQEVCK